LICNDSRVALRVQLGFFRQLQLQAGAERFYHGLGEGGEKMREKNIIVICGIICTTLIICGILFWPTLYRYDKTTNQTIVRINRVTGYTEMLYLSHGWEPVRNQKNAQAIPQGGIDKDSVKKEYELQERCAKGAAEVFHKWYGSEGLLTHYTNHYNKKLNKCFILIIDTNLPKDKNEHTSISKLLVDVNEQKEYGSFFMFTDTKEIMECIVLGNPCSSETEWDTLIKPYMED